MNKVLVVVDMQNDFIDGALANKDAQKIVKKVADFVGKWNGAIVFTRDTHFGDYLETMEGKHLPVPHCINETEGWQINEKILSAAKSNKNASLAFMDKTTFGAGNSLYAAIKALICKEKGYKKDATPEEIVFCGTCTDICVISNALALKALYSEVPIKVIPSLCAGLNAAKHKAAIEVMRSCQIEVLDD